MTNQGLELRLLSDNSIEDAHRPGYSSIRFQAPVSINLAALALAVANILLTATTGSTRRQKSS